MVLFLFFVLGGGSTLSEAGQYSDETLPLNQKMKYTDYLNTKHWKGLSKSIRSSRSRGLCRVCGSKDNLNVHHVKYNRNGASVLFKETPGVLRTLCNECHFMWHRTQDKRPFRSKHADRIRVLIQEGMDKESAFINCVGKDYRTAKGAVKATGVEVVGVATQKSLHTTPNC